MKKFLSDHLKIVVSIVIIYVMLLIFFCTPTNYAIIAPGGVTNLDQAFTIDQVEMDDHFYSIYVYSQDPITLFQYVLLRNNPNYEISLMTTRQSDTSILDGVVQGNISKIASYQTSLIKAYELAHVKDELITIDYDYLGLIIYDFPRRINEISIGDLIIGVDGYNLSESNFEDSTSLAYQREVEYTIQRSDGSIYTYTYHYQEDDVLFWFFPSYDIKDANPSFSYSDFNVIGGSSGGLMQTLNIYVSLLKLNITNVKIAGTGTIEMDGSIGKIGGIREKIITAEREQMDVFFIPESHIDDIAGLNYSYELVVVNTIDEAVNWLYENVIQ